MGIARIAILVVAALSAGVAALLVRNILSEDRSATASAPAQIVQMPTSAVLVASQDLIRGNRINSGSLRWQPWPEDAISPAYIEKSKMPKAIEDSVDAIVRMPMNAGEPVTQGKIVKAGDNGFLAAVLEPGMRAISTKISPESSAGGFILPNDRVDVILSEKKDQGEGRIVVAKTILENVRVLAIDQTIKEKEGEKVVVGKTATLELYPSQAETLVRSKSVGSLSLALRALADSGPNVEDKAQKVSSTGTVRIFRYGAESSVSVGRSAQ